MLLTTENRTINRIFTYIILCLASVPIAHSQTDMPFIELSDIRYDYHLNDNSGDLETRGNFTINLSTNCPGVIKAEISVLNPRLPLLKSICKTARDTIVNVEFENVRNSTKYVFKLWPDADIETNTTPACIVSDTIYVDNYIKAEDLSKIYTGIEDISYRDIDFSINNQTITIKDEVYSEMRLLIVSLDGRLIKDLAVSSKEINLAELPHGAYIIKLCSPQKSITKKMIL